MLIRNCRYIHLDVSHFSPFFFYCGKRCRRLSVTKRSILIFIFHLKSLSVHYVKTHKTKNLTSNNVSLMCFSSVFSMMDSQSNYLWLTPTSRSSCEREKRLFIRYFQRYESFIFHLRHALH